MPHCTLSTFLGDVFMNYCKTLTIAGSDSSGGAGIQADIKTMSALGCYSTTVITAITAQNTLGIYAIEKISYKIIAKQLEAVLDDIRPDAIKIGMVNDTKSIEVIADILQGVSDIPIVIDPVMVSTTGSQLMEESAIKIFRKKLIPLSILLTPNIPEVEVLINRKITNIKDVLSVANRLIDLNCKAVLVKGGHLDGKEKVDYLLRKRYPIIPYTSPMVKTSNNHGTGCTLSSAITSFIARGEDIEQAIQKAKEYITQSLIAGANIKIGQGHGAVNHFYNPQKLIKR